MEAAISAPPVMFCKAGEAFAVASANAVNKANAIKIAHQTETGVMNWPVEIVL